MEMIFKYGVRDGLVEPDNNNNLIGFNALIVKDGSKAKVLDLVIRVLLPLPLPLQDVVIDGC